jgi:hypothetical protein
LNEYAESKAIHTKEITLMFTNIFVSLALAVPIWAAQQAAPSSKAVHLEIRGHVVEFGGSQGIYDAEVTLERYEGPAVSSFVKRSSAGTAKTGADGSFAFSLESPGTYRVTVKKDGYGPAGGVFNRANWTSAEISVDADKPTGDVHFVLARPGEITGRVVDGDTEKPVPGMRALVLQHGYFRGQVRFMPGGEAVTDAEGRFAVSNLTPTDYVICLQSRIRDADELKRNPAIQGEARMLTEFSEEDFKKVDQDYDVTYWPGGGDATDAIPVALGSGGQIDLGALTVNKVSKYRVRVSFIGEPCLPNERWLLSLEMPSNPMGERIGTAACGRDVLIRGFAPGSYQLEVEGSARRGWTSFSIDDENLAIAVPVSRGVDIDGKVRVSEGTSRPDLQSMKIWLFPFHRALQNLPVAPDATGQFHIHRVPIRDFRLGINGVPKTHYLKEIRYNGHRLAGDTLAVDGNAHAHSIEIILGEKPAIVRGTVTDDDKPAHPAYAVLVRLSPNGSDAFSYDSGIQSLETDESGRFQFAGLAPGEYRLLAVSVDDKAQLDRPNTLGRLLGDAEKLSLGESQSQDVQLKLARP